MTEMLKKEIRILMFKINPWRVNYSVDKLFKGISVYDVLKNYKVSEEFLRYYIDKDYLAGPDWWPVPCQQDLSEQFMRDFKDKLDWGWVSRWQNLTESFMREMKDYVKWNNAAECQKMSEDFILENYDRVNYYCLVKNKRKDMKKTTEHLMYELSFKINEKIFEETFIKNKKITRKRLNEMREEGVIKSRFDILDIRG